MAYIYARGEWPAFQWQLEQLAALLADIRHRQGRLLGRMEALGFPLRAEASLRSLTEEILKSSEIEGQILDKDQVRSSIARRLGLEIAGLVPADRAVDGVVEMMLDATQRYRERLTADRLFGWHAALFPTGRSGLQRIVTGACRDDSRGPMQVVSGPIGREKVHFEAPPAAVVDAEMGAFLDWFEGDQGIDPVLRAGIAHFWFVTVHPFEDGNGRIARAVADMALARSEDTPQRFYSMSAQIGSERNEYYRLLEATQKGHLDITPWLRWFLECLGRAFDRADSLLGSVLAKARFWERLAETPFNDRQRKVLNRLLDGFEGKLTSSKYAKLANVSQDTAGRDIADLLGKQIIRRDQAGGRSTSYSLVPEPSVPSRRPGA
jgi:Fic family protein